MCGLSGSGDGRSLKRPRWLIVALASVVFGLVALGGGVSVAGPAHRARHRVVVPAAARVPAVVSRRARALERARLRALRSPAGRRAQARSRHAYQGLSRAQALSLLRRRFGFAVMSRPWGGLAQRLPRGDRILKYLGAFDARVSSGRGKHARTLLVESLTPLLGEPARLAGTSRARRYALRAHAASDQPPPGATPVDLTLENQGSFFAPVSSPTPVRIPEQAAGTVGFPNQGLGVRVVGADPSNAVLLAGSRVAYPSALIDTDLLVTPEAAGAEVFWQARSLKSPRDVGLGFDLPPGASLAASAAVPGGVDVMSNGNAVATVNPAQAQDAAGNPVPSSLRFSGSQVTVHVALDGPNVQFPVLVDPLVSVQDSYRLTTDGAGQKTGGSDSFAGWTWASSGSSAISGWTSPSATGSSAGMAVYNVPGTIADQAYGEWVYTAPANTFVQRADFGYMTFNPANDPGWACMYQGIYSFQHWAWESGDFNEYIGGNSSTQAWGNNPTLDCGNSSAYTNLPDGASGGTFRAYCVGANNVLNGNPSLGYAGYSYNGGRYFTYSGGQWIYITTGAVLNGSTWTWYSNQWVYVNNQLTFLPANTAMATPTQTADCNSEWPARSDQGTMGNAAVFGLQFSGSGQRSGYSVAEMYGADVYLAEDQSPTLDAPTVSGLPSSTTWGDSSGSVLCNSSVSGSACPSGGGPVARDSGLGVWAEALAPPTGSWTTYVAPNQLSPSTTCTGAPYHAPCPHVWSSTAFSYNTAGWPDGPQTMTLIAWNPMQWTPPPASIAYTLHVDHEAPNTPTFSGPLWDDRATNPDGSTNSGGSSSSIPMTGISYPMQITGADPGNASGPAEFDVSVDGGAPQVIQAQCSTVSASDSATQCGSWDGTNRSATVSYNFQNLDYTAGPHTICVTVKDQVAQAQNQPIANCRSGASSAAHTSQSSFTIYTKPLVSLGASQSANQNDQMGLESFYDYRKLATGAGSYARVDLATGNLVWDDIPVVDPGQGLSTFVEVAYNSQHRLGELAPLQNQALLPTGEYNQIGQGFSLGIDGLTRLNEPLDLSLQALGYISFTDVDGTRHTFIRDPNNAQHWIAPSGVFLWLRQWSTSDPSEAWAITRPDGVTFFFDQAGYETSVKDRQSNKLTFKSQSLLLGLITNPIGSCPTQLPVLGAGCTEQVTHVTDQNGQDMQVCYYHASGDLPAEPGCGINNTVGLTDARRLKVSDIIDHAGHDLHFDYDANANLTQMTVSAEPAANASRVFKFAYGGANDTQPAVAGLPVLSDLSPSLFPPAVTQITDPDGHATSIKYAAAQALDSSDPCPRDLSSPLPPALGGLVGLEPKCVVALTDRGGGQTNFSYTTGTDSSGGEIHTADVQGPRTDPSGSATRPDHWVDTTDAYGRPTQEQDPLSRTTLLTWNDTGLSQPANTLQKLVQASGTSDQVTTLYSYDQNGRLTDRQGPANTASGSTEKQNFREVQIHYQLSAGTLTTPSDGTHCSPSDSTLCFVSDPTSLTNQDGQTTTFTPDPTNPDDGLVTSITDPAGQSWSTKYDQYGRILSQTEPGTGGGTETTSYGSFDPYTGLPQTKTLPSDPANGNQPSVWHYAYDKLGNLLAVIDPRNTSPSAVDPNAPADGKTMSPYATTFAYDDLSRATAEYDTKDSTATPLSYVTKTYTYDPNDNLTAQTDGNGRQFTAAFTPMDWLASRTTPTVTQADGTTKPAQITSYCYDEQGDVSDHVTPAGQPATCAPGQPAASNHDTYTVYDGDGEPLVKERTGSAAGATNQLTSYAYDNRGDQVGMADPVANNGQTIAQAESNAQSATSGTVGSTWRTRTFYDAAGNPIETQQNPNASDGSVYVSRNQYDAAGLLLASEDARGPSLSKDDTTGEFPLSTSTPVADTTVYGYDARALLAQVTNPAGDATQIERAPDGKICALTAPNGPSVSESDCSAAPGAYKTTFSYYAQGWLKQITVPTAPHEYSYGSEPMTVAYTRDNAGYPTTITDPRGNAITNSFYDSGELKTTNRPSWWTYDPQRAGAPTPDPNPSGQGQVASDTPGAGLPIREKTLQEIYKSASSQQNQTFPSDEQAGKFGQVKAQQLPSILPPAGQTNFSYDGNGNLTGVADVLASNNNPDLQGTTTLRYDELGEPIEIDRPFDGANLTKTYYGYDADGNVTSADTPALTGSGQSASDTTYRTTNSYDGLDRLAESDTPGAGSAPGGSAAVRTTTYCYAMAPANGSSPCTPSGQPSQPVASVPASNSAQTFAVGERVAVVRPSSTAQGASDNVSYQDDDALGNVIQSIAPPPNATASPSQTPHTTYGYDAIGDQTLILRPLGQPSRNGGTANLAYGTQMSYDDAGRLKTSTRNNTETTAYNYDHDGNLTQVSAPGAAAGSGGSTVPQITSYVYNGRDLLWRTTSGAGSPADGQNSARTTATEYDGDGNLIRTVNPSAVGIDGMPVNAYDGSYTGTGTGTDSSGAANLDATIRVYNATNALTDVYLPWGCNLLPNSNKTACTTSAVADTRRFKEHFTVNQDQLNQVTATTEAYDWTTPSASHYTTTYSYQPNNWISSETDAAVDKINNFQPSKGSSYTYDPAGEQTGWSTKGITAATTTSSSVSRGYWPSGEVGAVCRGQSLSTCSTDPTVTPQPTFSYFYWPSGRQSQLNGALNGAGTSDSQSMRYFSDGTLNKLNDTITGTNGHAYDTVYTYDLDANVATRQQGGQITANAPPLCSYCGGSRTYFAYNGDDRETTMNVDGNDTSNGVQPHRTFTTSYWPSGQPQARTRIQCASAPCTGTPITESYFYNDDGSIRQDTRTSDNKDQTYAYDTDGNRSQDESGSHLYNALDQEVQWTRGASQDQANSGSTISYLLDGTGGLLRQIDSAGALANDGTRVPITTWYCSAATIGSVSGTASSSSSYSSGCQHDADRVEVLNSVSGNTSKVQISNPTVNYCYTSLAQLARVTIASCPADDATMQSSALQPGETTGTTAVYQHDGFGDQTNVKAPDPNSSASTPSVDTVSYSYDALDRRYAKTEQIASTWTGTATPQTSTYGYIGQSNQIAIEQDPDPSNPLTQVPHLYDYNSGGQKLGFWQGTSIANPTGVYHTYATDAKGSIEALENADNTINNLNRYHYTPYGNLEKGNAQGGGNPSSTTTAEQALGSDAETNNYRFEGFYEDSGVATYDLQARNYRPQEGLYTTQDSFEQGLGDQALRADPLTQNLYAFAGGNPTNNIEWDGHCSTSSSGHENFTSSPVSTLLAPCNATSSTGTPTTRNSQPGPEGCSTCGNLPPGGQPLTPTPSVAPRTINAVVQRSVVTAVAATSAAWNAVNQFVAALGAGGPLPNFQAAPSSQMEAAYASMHLARPAQQPLGVCPIGGDQCHPAFISPLHGGSSGSGITSLIASVLRTVGDLAVGAQGLPDVGPVVGGFGGLLKGVARTLAPLGEGAEPAEGADLPSLVSAEKAARGISPGRNGAVFEYSDAEGNLNYEYAFSQRGLGHAERLGAKALQEAGVGPESVSRIHSQLEPCEMPGGYCASFLWDMFPNAEVSWTYPYPPGPEGAAIRQASVQAMRAAGGG